MSTLNMRSPLVEWHLSQIRFWRWWVQTIIHDYVFLREYFAILTSPNSYCRVKFPVHILIVQLLHMTLFVASSWYIVPTRWWIVCTLWYNWKSWVPQSMCYVIHTSCPDVACVTALRRTGWCSRWIRVSAYLVYLWFINSVFYWRIL